jgi:uncharacterized protein
LNTSAPTPPDSSGNPSPVINAARLNDQELTELDELLSSTGFEECMSAEELDGFCCALACCTERIAQPEWLTEVLGEPIPLTKTRIGPKRFLALEELVVRHFASVKAQLAKGESFAPIVNLDEDGRAFGYGWAIGFACGMGLRPDAWDAIEDDDLLAEAFVPIMDLVDEANEGDEDFPDMTKEECDERINAMLDGVFDAYQFFQGAAKKAAAAKAGGGKPGAGKPKSAGAKKPRPR